MSRPRAELRWDLWSLHGAVLLFGAAGLFGKWISAHPLIIVFGRVLVASIAFWVIFRLRKSPAKRPAWPHWPLIVLAGVLLAFHWFAFFQSIQYSTVAIGLLCYSTAPLFTALLEPLFLKKARSWRIMAASLLSLAGPAVIVPRWDLADQMLQGVAWGVLSGLSFALLALINSRLRKHWEATRLAYYQDATAMAVLLPMLPLVPWNPNWGDVGLLIVLGLLCTALAHALFIHSLRSVRASLAALVSALEPVYGMVLALVLLGETPAMRTVGGGALILGAVLWATWPAQGNRGTPSDEAETEIM